MSIKIKFKALSNTPVLRNSELVKEVGSIEDNFITQDLEEYLRKSLNIENVPIVRNIYLLLLLIVSLRERFIPTNRGRKGL